MAYLRWILLLAGLLFLAGLAAWEMRRPRQARRDTLSPPERNEPELGRLGEAESDRISARGPISAPSHEEVPPLGTPLVISLDDPPIVPTLRPRIEPVMHRHEMVEQGELTAEPMFAAQTADQQATPEYAAVPEHTAALEYAAPEYGTDQPPLEPVPAAEPAQPAEQIRYVEAPSQLGTRSGAANEIVLPVEPMTPIVEWPPEHQRHIIAVRVVGATPDRMSGRPLRQALAACGFVHGRFGIFHQPGADGRALISAANLNKPGVFDPANMDFQRFRGLGLFAVLPGPLPPAAALDHLLDTATELAERLHARLQDEHGMPLDEGRLEAMARTVQDISNGALRTEPAA